MAILPKLGDKDPPTVLSTFKGGVGVLEIRIEDAAGRSRILSNIGGGDRLRSMRSMARLQPNECLRSISEGGRGLLNS